MGSNSINHGEATVAEPATLSHRGKAEPASNDSIAVRRRITYLIVGTGLIVSYLPLRLTAWQSSPELHTLMEGISTLLAVMVGVIALVHYYSRPKNSFLFLGVGFLGTALFDGGHAVLTSELLAPVLPSTLPSVITWSWLVSRFFLSVVMVVALLSWMREQRLGTDGKVGDRGFYLSTVSIAAASFLVFALVPLPRAYYPELPFDRPWEFAPALLFLFALVGFLRKGGWRTNPFEHWLVVSLILAVACQLVFMPSSQAVFDLEFDVAHVLKMLGYVCVLIGLLHNIYAVFHEAEASNANLQREVDERKRAEAELKTHQEELAKKSSLLETTLESMSHGIAVYDAKGRLLAFNRKSVELRDYPPGFLRVGMSFEDMYRYKAKRGYYGPGDPEVYVAERMAARFRQKNDRRERIRANGTVVAIHRASMPDGGYVTTYTDITKEKKIEEDLRRAKEQADFANRSKTEFLANMSHELRTPLNAIIGFSEVLRSEGLGPLGHQTYLEYAEDINASGNHLLGLINDILDLSKVEAGRVDLHESVFDPKGVVRACVSMVKGQAESCGLELVTEVSDDLSRMRADQRMVKQILLNLLSNAIKFTPEGGRVTIKAWSQPGGGNVFQVIDTGIGVALSDIPNILQPFAQADNALTRDHHGTGLGLPLSKKLVELHGGYLDFQSEAGRGSTVTVRFPKERMVSRHADEKIAKPALQRH